MRTYAVRAGYIPAAKVALFEAMVAEMTAMPDLEPAEDVSCHAVCRAFERLHPETHCVDGFFQAIGAVLFALWLLGMLGVNDFRICINAPVQCGTATRLTT